MTAPAFSVIVPAFNASRTLPATLASIAAQTHDDYEVVVVDDGSTDDTRELAERLGRGPQWRVVHQDNRGLPAARNAGIAAARGRWLAFLDSDDLWLPHYLATMRPMLERGDDVGLAYCDAWIYDERRDRVARASAFAPHRPADPPEEARPFFLALLQRNFVWVSACAPRSVLEELGGFNESLRAVEDWEMWLRIAGSGRRAVGTAERLGLYRHSAGQMHRDLHRMLLGRVSALESVAAMPRLPADLRDAVHERLAPARRDLETGAPPSTLRRLARPLARRMRPLWEFHRRTPPEIAAAFPELGRS